MKTRSVRKLCALALAALVTRCVLADSPILADDLIWLPIGDSITEGETWMGHADQGDVNSRGGYRYQLWREMEEVAGQPTVSVGYRTGHQSTVEDPTTCRWAWHAAQYGGAIMYDANGSHGAAGLCVESTLEVAGYPDVITVLIGVNDCSFSGANVSKVFETWVNMIAKLSVLRPKSTICVSTLLPAGGSRGYVDTFNTLVRAAATRKEAPFNLANVVFADMNQDAFGGTYDSQYFKGDNLHPNENGAKLIGAAFAEYLKAAATARATHAAELVSIDNGTAGLVTVRFNKALKSVTSATLTIAGTDVAGNSVSLALTDCAIDATNKRLLKFATSDALQGGTYTATLTNLAGTDGNELALPAELALTDSKFVEILGTGAEANVPASLRTGLTKHGTLTMADGTVNNGIGAGDNFAGNGPGEQFVVANELPPYVKRVAYYMELKRPGQPAQFVWASMDATTGFSSNSARIGIPTTSSGNVKALVTNLQVYGNRGNFTNSTVTDGVSSDVGIVEFSPYDWTAADQSGFPQDFNAGKFGWNDTLGTSTLKGCMQIAKVLRTTDIDKYTNPGAEMLFAYNNFNRANATDLAIGSFSTHRHNNGSDVGVVYDWTDFVSKYAYEKFAVNAYEVKNLEIWFEEGEAPKVLDIPAGSIVTKSASDPLAVPVTGEGRLVLDNYLPTDSAVLESLQDATHWTGTVEIRNYAPTANYGIIYFQNYANANSTVALNGVTATMYTAPTGSHPDQTFGALEITGNGWTTGTGDFTISPLYNCNLKGSGPITINHRGRSGVVNFCGDHSGFTGTINFATDADKGVALAPAGTGRTTGIPAKTIKVLTDATVGISGTTNGTIVGEGTIVADGAMPSAALQTHLKAETWTGTVWIKNVTVASFDLAQCGHANSTIRLTGFKGYSPNSNNGSKGFDGTVELVDDGNTKAWTITDTFASTYYVARLTGDGTFTTQNNKSGPARYAFKNVDGFSGSIDLANGGRSVTVGEVTQASDYVGAANQNTIKVLSGAMATIAADKVWRAGNGVVVEGTLGVNGTLENEVSGSGRLGYTKFNKVHANVKTGLKKAAWTGTLVITGDGAINEGTVDGSAYTTLNEYGSEASKIELAGTCSGYFGLSTKTGSEATPTVVQPELVVSGTWSQNSGYSQRETSKGYSTIFRKVSGAGTMSSPATKPNQLYYIEDASDFTGSLEAVAGKFVIGSRVDDAFVENGTITVKADETISAGLTWKASAGITLGGTVDFAAAPSAGDVALANGVSNGTVTLAEKAAYTVAGVADTKLALKVDGSRIVLASSYPDYVDVNDPEQVAAYDEWKTANAAALASATPAQAKEAYFFNCAPTAEALLKAEQDFKLTISIDADGKVTVSTPEGYHVKPVIVGAETVDGEYNLSETDKAARFFKAVIRID